MSAYPADGCAKERAGADATVQTSPRRTRDTSPSCPDAESARATLAAHRASSTTAWRRRRRKRLDERLASLLGAHDMRQRFYRKRQLIFMLHKPSASGPQQRRSPAQAPRAWICVESDLCASRASSSAARVASRA